MHHCILIVLSSNNLRNLFSVSDINVKNYARTLQALQWLLLHERVFHLHVSKQAAQIACNTVLPAQEPKQYCLHSNFQMVFFEKVSCHRFWKKCFQTQSRDIASCHYYSVILEVYFWKYRTVFEIFINITIQKLLRRWYTLHGKANSLEHTEDCCAWITQPS